MQTNWLRGCATALVTPFDAAGAVDSARMSALVKRQLEGGVKLLVPNGTTGESPALSVDEVRAIFAQTIELAHAADAKVIAGTGSNSTANAIKMSLMAQDLGADALLVVTPYYNKPTQAGLYAHYRALAEAVPQMPIVLYNVPGRTNCNLNAETTLRLAHDVPNIVGIKEASGNLSQIMAILRDRPAGFKVLSGDDALTLAMIALGAEGLVSVISNQTPDLTSKLVALALEGEWDAARTLHYKLLKLMDLNFIETSPAPVKATLAMMGLAEEHLRLPLVPCSTETKTKLKQALTELGLLEATAAPHAA